MFRSIVKLSKPARVVIATPDICFHPARIRLYSSLSSDAPKYQVTSLLKSAAAIALSGAGLLAYFSYERHKAEEKRKISKNASAGKPLVGGPFELVNVQGKPTTDQDFLGKFTLVYFGYTFCPDVCPEELEKMALAVDSLGTLTNHSKSILEKQGLTNIVPLFVSVDPRRDSLQIIKDYLLEFSPKFVGLTGTTEQIKKIAKAYRMYYSAPPSSLDTEDSDYLVDHSIFFFLMGPDGKYLCHFGKIDTAEVVAEKIKSYMEK